MDDSGFSVKQLRDRRIGGRILGVVFVLDNEKISRQKTRTALYYLYGIKKTVEIDLLIARKDIGEESPVNRFSC
jgi:hypothetical protein